MVAHTSTHEILSGSPNSPSKADCCKSVLPVMLKRVVMLVRLKAEEASPPAATASLKVAARGVSHAALNRPYSETVHRGASCVPRGSLTR